MICPTGAAFAESSRGREIPIVPHRSHCCKKKRTWYTISDKFERNSPLCQREVPHVLRVHRPHDPEVGVGVTNTLLVQKLEYAIGVSQEVGLRSQTQTRAKWDGIKG